MMNNYLSKVAGFILLSLLFISSFSCDDELQPLADNESFFFSVYGFLDGTKSENWLRIIPVRETTEFNTESFETTVTLENLNTGEKIILEDSLFQSDFSGVSYWNFRSDLEIIPEHTYRLEVFSPDGRKSTSTVTIPPDYPTPVITIDEGLEVQVNDVEHLADIQSIWEIRQTSTGNRIIYNFSHLNGVLREPDFDRYTVTIDTNEVFGRVLARFDCDSRTFFDNFQVLSKQVFIVSAGPVWELYEGNSREVLALPDAVSNVENGVGFMFGAVSKTIPWKSCKDENRNTVACPLEEDRGFSVRRIDRTEFNPDVACQI